MANLFSFRMVYVMFTTLSLFPILVPSPLIFILMVLPFSSRPDAWSSRIFSKRLSLKLIWTPSAVPGMSFSSYLLFNSFACLISLYRFGAVHQLSLLIHAMHASLDMLNLSLMYNHIFNSFTLASSAFNSSPLSREVRAPFCQVPSSFDYVVTQLFSSRAV